MDALAEMINVEPPMSEVDIELSLDVDAGNCREGERDENG
jgi:hypothetical protein